MLKDSDLDIFGVIFDSKVTFEKHISSVSTICSCSKALYLEEVLASIEIEIERRVLKESTSMGIFVVSIYSVYSVASV